MSGAGSYRAPQQNFQTLYWDEDALVLLDQTKLPREEIYRRYKTSAQIAEAIRTMVVRGAPAIGITAAYGVAAAACEIEGKSAAEFFEHLQTAIKHLGATRPTAVNLFWALQRMENLARKQLKSFDLEQTRKVLLREALRLHEEDVAANRRMGELAQRFIPDQATILTHCNAGALATGGFGTALGVIYAAKNAGKKVRVFADETRPFLQGTRLTCWELQKAGVPVTLLCDNMAGHIMKTRKIDLVVVGADRIAMNGDVANKIGTYPLAIIAREHGVPFYVAAPTSTVDPQKKSGAEIPIEIRTPSEVTQVGQIPLAPEGISVENPAFDVTPAKLVTAIITEAGVAERPYEKTLPAILAKEVEERFHG